MERMWWNARLEADSCDTLIAFGVHVDHDGTDAWLTHDGDRITLDIALDLATAVVENLLDA